MSRCRSISLEHAPTGWPRAQSGRSARRVINPCHRNDCWSTLGCTVVCHAQPCSRRTIGRRYGNDPGPRALLDADADHAAERHAPDQGVGVRHQNARAGNGRTPPSSSTTSCTSRCRTAAWWRSSPKPAASSGGSKRRCADDRCGRSRIGLATTRRPAAAVRRQRQADRARSDHRQADRELRQQRRVSTCIPDNRPARRQRARRQRTTATSAAQRGGRGGRGRPGRRTWRRRRARVRRLRQWILDLLAAGDLQEPRDSRRLRGRKRRGRPVRRSAGVRREDRQAGVALPRRAAAWRAERRHVGRRVEGSRRSADLGAS